MTRLIWRRWKGRRPTGIDRVTLAYLHHFRDRSQAVIQHERYRRILGIEASQQLFALLDQPGNRFKSSLLLGALRNFGHPVAGGRGRIYLNVGHTGLNLVGFRAWVERSHVRPVYMVHDLIPISNPQFCRPGEDEKHRERMRAVLHTASGIIANSQVTLDELSRFAAEEMVAMPPSIAVWLGCDPLPMVREIESLSQQTFVVLGTIEARKNHLMLLNVWSNLIDRMGDRAPQLLIIGQRGWEADDVFERLDRDGKLRGHVIELNDCSDDELARHLGGARALLFPSLSEGYGMPLMEALGSGVPVIASNLPALREIGGVVPTYLEPSDHESWERVIVEFASSLSAERTAQIRRMNGFHAPTWTEHFNAVENWLGKLPQQPRRSSIELIKV